MPLTTDFHQLDTCDCGGTLDAWTYHYSHKERLANGLYGVHYRTVWICQDCGDYSDQSCDENGHEIHEGSEELDMERLEATPGSSSAKDEKLSHTDD